MIIGIGIDLVDLERMERSWRRFGRRLAERVLGPEELAMLPRQPVLFLASRFAVKEAAAKALGCGFAGGVAMPEIQTLKEPSGRPLLRLSGRALEKSLLLGVRRLHLSLTHSRTAAAAVVLLED